MILFGNIAFGLALIQSVSGAAFSSRGQFDAQYYKGQQYGVTESDNMVQSTSPIKLDGMESQMERLQSLASEVEMNGDIGTTTVRSRSRSYGNSMAVKTVTMNPETSMAIEMTPTANKISTRTRTTPTRRPTTMTAVVKSMGGSRALASMSAPPAPTATPMMSPPATPSQDDYALKTNEVWYWNINGSPDPNVRLACSMQSDGNGRTVAVERLMEKISYVSCTKNGMKIKWRDTASYNAAKSNWSWVNNSPERYIMMVLATPSCADGERKPYRVSQCESDDDTLMMTMAAIPQQWKDGFPVMNLRLSTSGLNNQLSARDLQRRQDEPGASINMGRDFSGANIIDRDITDNINLSLKCSTCNTAGFFDIDADVDFNFSVTNPITGTIIIRPRGISATIGLSLVAEGELSLTESVEVLSVVLPGGVDVLGLVGLGPSLTVNMDADLSLSAAAELNLGSITLAIDDNSQATFDFSDSANNAVNGFTPIITAEGPSVNAEITANGNFGPNIVLGLSADLSGIGIAAGIALAAPRLDATLTVNGADCPAGVQIDAGLDAQLNAFGGVGNIAEVAAESTLSIIGTSTQIFGTCITVPTAEDPTAAPLPPPGTGGVVGSVLSEGGCQQVLGAQATLPGLCATDGGDPALTAVCQGTNQCCNGGLVCSVQTLNGATGNCCG